jgi:hypothetical protein
MTGILATRADEARRAGEALIREADDPACQSWNERMWADGGPIDPCPTIDQAINGGYTCIHLMRASADRWPDHVRLSDVELKFTCKACGRKGADIRPDFNRNRKSA